ncbi:MAG TPA: hypothetical protein VLL52_08870 [Anaerolineae bacterium]|nr:hypothetical protein [Anaerolineae bacterium]
MANTIILSDKLYQQVEQQAKKYQWTVTEWVQETVKRELQTIIDVEGGLPPWLQTELQAMQQLSDSALWALAKSHMPTGQREELARLNMLSKQRELTSDEKEHQALLLRYYNEAILRRAHAAVLLQTRGFDMSNPDILQEE